MRPSSSIFCSLTLVPIALLLLVGYVGPVSAAACTAILVTLSTAFFGFWGAALSAVLLVPILVVSSYMVEHEQSFWQSAAGSGVTMFASIGLAMLLVSALARADVVTARDGAGAARALSVRGGQRGAGVLLHAV